MAYSQHLLSQSCAWTVRLFIALMPVLSVLPVDRAGAQDLLRRGAAPVTRTPATSANSSSAAARAAAAQAAGANENARDALRRTSQAISAVQAMQAAARATAAAQAANNLGLNPRTGQQLPNVPNGLGAGGLNLLTIRQGAQMPTQQTSGTSVNVEIKQTQQQALLHWQTFNVGRDTTLHFDQSAGGADASKWIAYNKVFDPSGHPSQIIGAIKAEGQVYVLNPNGIIFGANSQVNVRGLTASSLPLNDNLRQAGVLNNPDAQFLFSALSVPGGSDGTSTFDPFDAARSTEVPLPSTPDGRFGDVTVQAGAQLSSPVNADGNGGRIVLAGANVSNEGTISTPSGQTILAGGLQVGVQGHATNDPSLRGLDVWVGDAGAYGGRVTHSGLIESQTGSVIMAGKDVRQLGVIDSSTSVALNGRIDLSASYGAVGNPLYDNDAGAPTAPFLFQQTGTVTFGPGSVTRILPDYTSSETVPGTVLPEVSQINVEGLAIHLETGAMVLAPNGDVGLRAGRWPYKDLDGNRTTLNASDALESNLLIYSSGGMLFDQGQVYLDRDAFVNVAGSTDVYVPLSQSILTLKLLGQELADSPLQRTGDIRGQDITVDIRTSGTYNGKYWVGTPLGDVTGFANLIERNAAQLTANGGNVTIQAGNSAVFQRGSVVDVSGGYAVHEGGTYETTKLIAGDSLIDIASATPDMVYDGIFDGKITTFSRRWGGAETFRLPLSPLGSISGSSYIEGGKGGTLTITAPGLALDGDLIGHSVSGPRQRNAPPQPSSLKLTLGSQELYNDPNTGLNFINASPNPPRIEFRPGPPSQTAADPFSLIGNSPAPLRADRLADVILSPDLLGSSGYGKLTVENVDGDIVVPSGVIVEAPLFGSVSLTGANVTVGGQVVAPGGTLSFTALNFGLNAIGKLPPSSVAAAPAPNVNRGLFTLESGGLLSAAGSNIDERFGGADPLSSLLVMDGGSVTVNAYSATLGSGSVIDVSGGVSLDSQANVFYGQGGAVSVLTGKDPNLGLVRGGRLALGASLRGYSGATGGDLTLQASAIQVGGASANPDAFLLQPIFFQQGGFTNYNLIGVGSLSSVPPLPGEPDNYVPGVTIAPGTAIQPLAQQLRVNPSVGATQPLQIDRILAPLHQRPAASLQFSAVNLDDSFTIDTLELRGDIVMGAGSRIATDPGASVSFNGQTVTLLGSIAAPGGTINVSAAGRFPLAPSAAQGAAFGLPTIHIGPDAGLSTAGTTVLTPDPYGRRMGTVLPGGTISLSGNIVAESGALLDVSGTSALLNENLAALGRIDSSEVLAGSGLTAPLWALQTYPVRVDSNGGRISLNGSQMLYSDATLAGRAGGASAGGGTLSVVSSRFYAEAAGRTGADINLVVTQSGRTLSSANTAPGIGRKVLDQNGLTLQGMGAFVADRFLEGGFDSLYLGSNYQANADPVAYGGNLRFQGPVSLTARGALSLAGGGVITADSLVNLSASYIKLGQPFRAPLNPQDQVFLFSQFPQDPVTLTSEYRAAPTPGTGDLKLEADLIDVGTLLLQNIGNASLNAGTGDIRGNGTLSVAGDLSLHAGQIYPTTLSAFNVFAYDNGVNKGSVTIAGSGTGAMPLSAGGSLGIFASVIDQGGVLRAPMGSIALGWDGTGTAPLDRIAGGKISVAVTSDLTLKAGSLTSVSALNSSGEASVVPFGLSPDGLSWVDPSGLNTTISGLPQKSVSLAGNVVTAETGSTVDIRGGGDLYAYRWVRGAGGSMDLLGTASSAWGSGTEYEAGDLVTYSGHTWSARVGHSGQAPAVGAYWSLVPESFAIVPGQEAGIAPYASHNTGTNADSLGGDPGYVDSGLQVGDRIYLEASPGLAAGYYTLLPKGYARLPGAYLVTPREDGGVGTVTMADGASFVSGYRFNQFTQTAQAPALRSRFEVAPPSVVENRVNYEDHLANTFFAEAATRLALSQVQRLPADAGVLSVQGNTGLSLGGGVLSGYPLGGRGSSVDISTFAALNIIGGTGTAPVGASAVLRSDVLNSWGVESLLLGGLRQESVSGISLDVRTSNITLNNPGASLSAPEITLASKDDITVTAGSAIASPGPLAEPSAATSVPGDGTLIRVSGDVNASVSRPSVTGSAGPLLTIEAGAQLGGASVILDSTYGATLDPTAQLSAGALTLGSGQISVLFQAPGGTLTGSVVDPHLVLSGNLLNEIQEVGSLTLNSYRTIDFYGTGSFGSNSVESLRLFGGGIRGYNQGNGAVSMHAKEVLFGNPSGVAALTAPSALTGMLQVEAETFRFGANSFLTAGYDHLAVTATKGVVSQSSGSFNTKGHLSFATPLVTGLSGSAYSVAAEKTIALTNGFAASQITPGLGATLSFAGSSVTADTFIRLPSGQLTLRATAGDVSVGGNLDVKGISQAFYDVVRYAGAGRINLESVSGNIELRNGSVLSVSAHPDGGDAGMLSVTAPFGQFKPEGTLEGQASVDGKAGSFYLDAGSLPTVGTTINAYAPIRQTLFGGGFSEAQEFRLRTNSVTLDGITNAAKFSFAADQGSITVTGTIDASGATGGSIALAARDDVTLQNGALLNVRGQHFSSAGKGGGVVLSAGAAINGAVNSSAKVTIGAGSTIDLGVDDYAAGPYFDPSSSAFLGQFAGTLHLRAPRTGGGAGTGVGVNDVLGNVVNPSSILVEGVSVYDLTATGGSLSTTESTAASVTVPDTSAVLLPNGTTGTQRVRTTVASQAYVPPGATSLQLTSTQSVTLPGGTGTGVQVQTTVAATITNPDGSTASLAANTPAALVPGAKIQLVSAGALQFTGGSEQVLVTIPAGTDVQLPANSTVNLAGAGTLSTSGSGTVLKRTGVREAIQMDSREYLGQSGTTTKNYTSILGSVLGTQPALASVAVLSPGVEIINRNGDLTLGTANPSGSPTPGYDSLSAADWDLSSFRYGAKSAPGVLTLRAAGDLVFNNTLSDGFTPVTASFANGHSSMWLALPQTINANLPVNTQSWSYRLTAGADMSAANHQTVLPLNTLDISQPGKGSVMVGEFYPAVPNSNTSGGSVGIGSTGVTASTIRISTSTSQDRGNRYEVIRTGTGSIDVSAGRDVQLRNPLATIYTAGVAVPTPTQIYQAGDFVIPVIPTSTTSHPSQGDLGAIQQLTQPRWTMAGGDLMLQAGKNIGHYTMYGGNLIADTSRQIPNNWLYRRGYVNSSTGLFASDGGGSLGLANITDTATSTAWWVDFSNFFQSVGALGGGNVSLEAGGDIVNVDASIPTNARMPGRDPATGQTVAPDASKLLEWGGGELSVQAAGDISGGMYYAQRGLGRLSAGKEITTNQARSPSLGILGSTSLSQEVVQSQNPAIYDPLTWLPTTLFVGNSQFQVEARGDVLLGPVTDPFLLPQGLNNRFWYKTYFSTLSEDAGADVASYGGSVTHRLEVTMPGDDAPRPILSAWLSAQNLSSSNSASNYQPWLRLAETDITMFDTLVGVHAPNLRSTAFQGSMEVVGALTLFPSPQGSLELLASGGISGLAATGRSTVQGKASTIWSSSTVNLSDADPELIPGVQSPLAYQSFVGRSFPALRQSEVDALSTTSDLFEETGSSTGSAASLVTQGALHARDILHANDPNPVRIYGAGGDISGFELFSSKFARVLAERDISDVSLYLQNTGAADISLVAAGRDVIPFNDNASLRTQATDFTQGNAVAASEYYTNVAGGRTSSLAGDIQISGPGLLEVLAGRNLDLGTGANLTDGTGVGISSIGNRRNPFLPFAGADILAMAGVQGTGGSGPAIGLSGSSLDFAAFQAGYMGTGNVSNSDYLRKIGHNGPFSSLSPEQQAIVALEKFFRVLREAGLEAARTGDYREGFAAIRTLYGDVSSQGDIFARARDVRTVSGGSISLAVPSGGVTMASDIFGNPLAPPGIVTEYGGGISIFSRDSVSIGQARIFTLRGGDLLIWSSTGDIAAGSAPRTVVTAPPTRVLMDAASAAVQTDLGGLATGGGIGVLASVEGVVPGSVNLIAPAGVVDAGDAGIRATGNITIAAVQVLNASNIAAGGNSVGVPSAPSAVAAPSLGAVSAAASASGATSNATEAGRNQDSTSANNPAAQEMTASLITAEVIGYGGGDGEEPDAGQPAGSPAQPDQSPPNPKPEEDEEGKKKKVAFAVPSSLPPPVEPNSRAIGWKQTAPSAP